MWNLMLNISREKNEYQKERNRLRIWLLIAIFLVGGMLWATSKCYGGNSHYFNEDLQAIETEVSSAISASETGPEITVPTEWSKTAPGPLSIPSFAWGCAFGIAGIVVVNACTSSEKESRKALKGCLINGVVTLTANVIVFVATL